MSKYKGLAWKHPWHYQRFISMVARVKQTGVGCDFKKTYEDFKLFIEVMGPIPSDMDTPSVGRIDHSKGYVFDTENNRWNFAWQSMSDNAAESIRRNLADVEKQQSRRRAFSEAAKRKFETTDAAQQHSESIKQIWATEEGRTKYLNATRSCDSLAKRSAKMKELWSDETKKEDWRKSLSAGQTLAWQNGSYAGKSGFVVKMTCPRCGKTGNKAPMERWGHGPDCQKAPA
jgi:hypothetical protein